jgi:hypothetical protein
VDGGEGNQVAEGPAFHFIGQGLDKLYCIS